MDRTKEMLDIIEKLGESAAQFQILGMHSEASAIQIQIINLRKLLEN